MKLAILFWCYKRPEICEDRLRHLRAESPGTKIYCLFGGEIEEAEEYRRRLEPRKPATLNGHHLCKDPWTLAELANRRVAVRG